jgi:hypothetical protein
MSQDTENQILTELRGISDRLTHVETRLENVETNIGEFTSQNEKFNDKFTAYQQGVQWVVQLAFSLIASVTVITIISTIFKK